MRNVYFLFLILTVGLVSAQTTLAPGDLVIIGVSTDNPDEISFAPLVSLDPGTTIYFTDSGWESSSSAFRGNEGAILWTAPGAGLLGGTVVSVNVTDTTVDIGSVTNANDSNVGNNNMNLSASGDQVLAFQGTTASPTFITAVQTNSTEWQADATSANNSALPPGLTNGVNALAFGTGTGTGDEFDNAWYSGSLTSGTNSQILAAVYDVNNWTGNNSSYSPQTTDFVITNLSVSDISNLEESTKVVVSNNTLIIQGLEAASVAIYDLNGRQVANSTDLSTLANGIYLIRITDANGNVVNKKFIK